MGQNKKGKEGTMPNMGLQKATTTTTIDEANVGYFSDVRINPQAHGYRCSFNLRVFRGYWIQGNMCVLTFNLVSLGHTKIGGEVEEDS
jgi:hypothetical protein